MNSFDEAAAKAKTELPDDLSEMTAADIAAWFARWYRSAGHKRLGRLLVARAKAMAAA